MSSNSNHAEMLVKSLGVLTGEIAVGVNGPFLFEGFGLYVPLAVATAVVMGAALGYVVAGLLYWTSHRERAAAPTPVAAMRQEAHPKAA